MCIHAAECVKRLPNVYNPNAKPWITIENTTSEELISQIDACPSGALTYKSNSIENQIEMEETTKIDVLENGPLLVHGTMEVTNCNR